MASYEIFITFGIYLVFLIAIGVYFYSKTTTHESYVLGDRGEDIGLLQCQLKRVI